jgi:hypothetical protein
MYYKHLPFDCAQDRICEGSSIPVLSIAEAEAIELQLYHALRITHYVHNLYFQIGIPVPGIFLKVASDINFISLR